MNRTDIVDLDDLSLLGLLRCLWNGKWWVLGGMLVLGGLAAGLAYSITPMYRVETTVTPVSDDDSATAMAALQGQLGSLMSLVGASGAGSNSNATESLAVLTSRDFIEQFIAEEKLLPVLFGDRWDAKARSWRVKPGDKVPTLQDGYIFFSDTLYRVQQDRLTGLITLSVDWYDAKTAVHWVELLVARLNARMRARVLAEADQSLEYLHGELARADKIELQESINRLIETQTKRAMFARTRMDYALRMVDRPLAPDPDRPIRPKRVLMIILGSFAGVLIGLAIVLVRYRVGSGRVAGAAAAVRI